MFDAGLIVVGVLIFLLSFLGLWGTIRENRRVLIVYFAFVLFFVVVEFAVGIAAIVLRNDLPVLLDPLWTTVRNTDDQAILTIETQFQCCGYTNTYDRAVPPYVTTVPLTPTCMGIHTENGYPTYIGGCYSEIFQFIKLSNNVSEATKLQQEVHFDTHGHWIQGGVGWAGRRGRAGRASEQDPTFLRETGEQDGWGGRARKTCPSRGRRALLSEQDGWGMEKR